MCEKEKVPYVSVLYCIIHTLHTVERGESDDLHTVERGEPDDLHAVEQGESDDQHTVERGESDDLHTLEWGESDDLHTLEWGESDDQPMDCNTQGLYAGHLNTGASSLQQMSL